MVFCDGGEIYLVFGFRFNRSIKNIYSEFLNHCWANKENCWNKDSLVPRHGRLIVAVIDRFLR